MGGAIAKVLIVMVLVVYCAGFIAWNSQTTTVVGWDLMGYRYVQDMPLAYLALEGALLGAVLMAIAAWGEWARQKRRANVAAAQVAKANNKLQELAAMIKQQRAQIAELGGGQPEPSTEHPPAAVDDTDL